MLWRFLRYKNILGYYKINEHYFFKQEKNMSEQSKIPAGLYIVATPIGNMGDFSERAIKTLKSVDLVLSEDTRHFGKLAKHFGIEAKKVSLHDHNEASRVELVVSEINSGKAVALVSDAGTPCISDPGYRVVRACRKENLTVSTIPGACAAISALSMSGLPSDQFLFKGFVPQKSGKRESFWKDSLAAGCTVIAYESPHRISKSMKVLSERDPEREVFVAREISKLYEESFFGTCKEISDTISSRSNIKGEIVVVLSK